ncbi:MAG: hypothetical protein LBE76_05800 [Nitrososphaerota archaeon]|nr:hypothetical protein [Nitrososphaerota archaeon]
MSLSSIEMEILESMLLNGKPIEAIQIANENNKELSVTTTYLTKLTHRGYVNLLKKELYMLTDEGKKTLGIQPITKENAKSIIAYAPHDKAFNFHTDTNEPLHIHAHSLYDFGNKITRVDLKSIEFHMNKDDFRTWFDYLGAKELAKKTSIIKKKKIGGEQLRILLCTTVDQHCQELMKLTEQTTI